MSLLKQKCDSLEPLKAFLNIWIPHPFPVRFVEFLSSDAHRVAEECGAEHVAGWKLRTWVRLVWRHYPGGKHFPKSKPKFVSLTDAKLGLLWVNKQVLQTFYCHHPKNEHRLGGRGVLSTSRRTFVGCMRGLLNR